MGILEIKETAKTLTEKERRELVAYLIHLDLDKDPGYIDWVTRKIDEKDKFVRWEDVKDRLQGE